MNGGKPYYLAPAYQLESPVSGSDNTKVSTNSTSGQSSAGTSTAYLLPYGQVEAGTSTMSEAKTETVQQLDSQAHHARTALPTLVPPGFWHRPFTTFIKILIYLLVVSISGVFLALVIAALSFFFLLIVPLLPVAALMHMVAILLARWQNRWKLNTWPPLNMWKFRALYLPSSTTNRPIETFIVRCWRLLTSPSLWRTITWSVTELALCVAVAAILTFWLLVAIFGTLSIPLNAAYPGLVSVDLPTPFNQAWFITAAGVLALITLYPLVLGLFALTNMPFFILTYRVRNVEDLEKRVALAEQQFKWAAHQRDSAIASESRQLRELERNLHDGPQQSLVRTTLDIAMARRKITHSDTSGALDLLDQALSHANSSLSQLRLLVRGFGPPALQEHGLPLALEDLAAACAIPVSVEGTLAGKEIHFPPALEQGLYFVAAEALTNTVKYAHALHATISISAQASPQNRLVLTIFDNGKGGAQLIPEHGLAGLADRMEALGGSLNIASDSTGTTITAYVNYDAT